LFQGLIEIFALLHPARHIERTLQCLIVFSPDLATVAPSDKSIQRLTVTGKFAAREVMDLMKLRTYSEVAPSRFEFGKARVADPNC
jgi:hypothetical protein